MRGVMANIYISTTIFTPSIKACNIISLHNNPQFMDYWKTLYRGAVPKHAVS